MLKKLRESLLKNFHFTNLKGVHMSQENVEVVTTFFANHEEISTTVQTPLMDDAINANRQAENTMNQNTEDLKSTAAHKEILVDVSNFSGWSKTQLEYLSLFVIFAMIALVSMVLSFSAFKIFLAIMAYFGVSVTTPILIAFCAAFVGLTYLVRSKLAAIALFMSKHVIESIGWMIGKTSKLGSKITGGFESFKNLFKKKEQPATEQQPVMTEEVAAAAAV